jgi:hypothetical protein
MNEKIVEAVARQIVMTQLTRQYIGELANIGVMIEIDRVWPEFVPEARAALAAHEAALAEAGMVIVPREPTKAMLGAGADLIWTRVCNDQNGCNAHALLAWRAMIDATNQKKRPDPPEGAEPLII